MADVISMADRVEKNRSFLESLSYGSAADRFIKLVADVLIPVVADSTTQLSVFHTLDDLREFREKLDDLCQSAIESIDEEIQDVEAETEKG